MYPKQTQCPKVLLLLSTIAWLLLSFNVHSSNAAPKVVVNDEPTLNNLNNADHTLSNNESLSDLIEGHIRNKRFGNGEIAGALIRPFLPTYFGTKWCGDNPRETKNIKNLGLFSQTDRCCQQHYLCTQQAKRDFDLTYTGKYTGIFRACICDDVFYNCLVNVQPVLSSKRHIIIGEDYFNNLAPKCIGYSRPLIECTQYQNPGGPDARCMSYKVAENESERLVVVDNLRFQLPAN